MPTPTTPAEIVAGIQAARAAAESDRRLADYARTARYLPASARRAIARMLDHAADEWERTESALFNALYGC